MTRDQAVTETLSDSAQNEILISRIRNGRCCTKL